MYSTNFKFFLEHQISLITTNNGKHIKFCSRLESKCFYIWNNNRTMTDDEINEKCYEIFNSLEKDLDI